jgi:hypothetical protein
VTHTYTRTHVHIEFADPHLICLTCAKPVPSWHNEDECGCDAGWWNNPCEHKAGITTLCPSWGPVDGCRCTEPHVSSVEAVRRALGGQP